MSLGRGFTPLWAGSAAGNLSDGLIFVAIPLLATSLTSNALLIAGLAVVYSAVRLLAVVPIGVYVDRVDRRTMLWVTNLIRAALLVATAVLFAVGLGSLPYIYLVLAGIGVLEAAADNAALSILPLLVPIHKLDRANSRISAAQLIADEFVGPPLGGLLFAFGLALPVLAAGSLYLAAGLFFLALPRPRVTKVVTEPRPSVVREAAAGARWLRGHRLLRGLAVVGGLASVAYMMPFSVLVLFSQKTLGLDSAGYGLILAISALGGLVGSAITVPLRSRIGYGWTVTASLVLGSAAMLALAFVRAPGVAAVLLAAYILHAVVWGICVNSLRQRLVPDALRGRVNASARVLSLSGLTTGALVGGLLAESYSLSAPFLASGALFLGCAVVVWYLFRADQGPDARLGECQTPTMTSPAPRAAPR
jgi:MFS family permease